MISREGDLQQPAGRIPAYPYITVIIPNWNGRHLLRPCLDSLREQTLKNFKVTVVDDASTDDSVGFVREHYPEVEVFPLQQNRGFCGAVNAGIKATDSEFVALLNNDTEVSPRWLEELHTALSSRADLGFCASKMVAHDDHTRIDSAGLFLRVDGVGRAMGYGRLDGEEFAIPKEVFGASGGAAMYKRSMLEDIGLFDEDFVAYGEDLDLSFRAQLRGYRCLYVPGAVVYHHGSATFGRISAFKVFHSSKNMLNILVKNMPTSLLIRYCPKILIAQAYQVLYFSVMGQGAAVLKGKMAALRDLKATIRKRNELMKSRKVSDHYINAILHKDYRDSAILQKEAGSWLVERCSQGARWHN